nr:phosphoglucomutase/phosphomannomutase family protein [Anaerolineae bacterium]
MSDIRFGTDGWRGRIAEDYTFDNLRRCAQGFATYLLKRGGTENGAVIGYDQRFHSENFAAAAAEVLAANGIKVWLTDHATPTPVISYGVVERKVAGGINITASHNPPWDNGFKVRDHHGGAVDPEGLKEIEASIPDIGNVKRMPLREALASGKVVYFDADTAYIDHLADLIDLQPIKDAGFHIVVEPMWGNGIGWLPRLLSGGTTTVTEIHNERNPLFPEMARPEPIPPNVDKGLEATVRLSADVCIIFDGDADRVGAGTQSGEFINQLQMYALLALYLLEIRNERGAIVKTLSTTTMLNKLGKLYDVPVYETGVGFKYVAPKMLETDAMIGGEESGGFAFRGNVPERDGILAGLFLLDFMVKKGMKPTQLIDHLYSKVGPHFYKRVDTRLVNQEMKEEVQERVNKARPDSVAGLAVQDIITLDGYKYALEDGGWLLIRFSGTEPLIRVYCETTHEDKLDAIIQAGLKIAGIE